jgi:hypothetical protein
MEKFTVFRKNNAVIPKKNQTSLRPLHGKRTAAVDGWRIRGFRTWDAGHRQGVRALIRSYHFRIGSADQASPSVADFYRQPVAG